MPDVSSISKSLPPGHMDCMDTNPCSACSACSAFSICRCAGALLQSRVKRVVWGAPNVQLGADGSWISLLRKDDDDDEEREREEEGEGEMANMIASIQTLRGSILPNSLLAMKSMCPLFLILTFFFSLSLSLSFSLRCLRGS